MEKLFKIHLITYTFLLALLMMLLIFYLTLQNRYNRLSDYTTTLHDAYDNYIDGYNSAVKFNRLVLTACTSDEPLDGFNSEVDKFHKEISSFNSLEKEYTKELQLNADYWKASRE